MTCPLAASLPELKVPGIEILPIRPRVVLRDRAILLVVTSSREAD